MNESYFELVLLLPLITFFIPLFSKRNTIKITLLKKILFITTFFCFISSIVLINQLSNNQSLSLKIWNWLSIEYFYIDSILLLPINIAFLIDQISMIFYFMVTTMASLIYLYLIGKEAEQENSRGYLALFSLLIFFIQIAIFSENIIMLILSWSSVGIIISLLANCNESNEFPRKFLLPNSIGDLCLLTGGIAFYFDFGTISFSEIKNLFLEQSPYLENSVPRTPSSLTCILIILGVLIKTALIPFHSWPLYIKNEKPSLLIMIGSGTTLSIGIFLLIRLTPILTNWEYYNTILFTLGATMAILGAIISITKRSIREILLSSTIYNFGFILISCSIGTYINAILYTIGHCFWKGALFMGEALITNKVRPINDIFQVKNIKRSSPLIFWCFILSSLPFLGLPGIFTLCFQHEILQVVYYKYFGDKQFFLILIAIILGSIYITRFIGSVFFRPSKTSIDNRFQISLPAKISFIGMALISLTTTIGGLPKNILWSDIETFEIPLTTLTLEEFTPIMPNGLIVFLGLGISLIAVLLTFLIYVSKEEKQIPEKIKYALFPLWNFIEQGFMIDKFFHGLLHVLSIPIKMLILLMENIIIMPLKAISLIVYQTGVFLNLKDFKNIEGSILYIILGITIMITLIFNNFNL